MNLRNRHRREVDPVPFAVVALLAFAATFSFGPGYLLELGLSLDRALLVCATVTAGTTALAYYRLIWTARPDVRGEIPAWVRLRSLIYAGMLLCGLLGLLSLPLLL